jgi:hypothetical protein
VARNLVLAGSLALIAVMAFFLFASIASNGITGLAVVTAGILAVLGFGVIGALTHKPDD